MQNYILTFNIECHTINLLKRFDWNKEKNAKLKATRNISFEEIVLAIKNDDVIRITSHTNKKRYPNQKMYLIQIRNYVYLVPFIEDKEKVFLKTIIPSRKATKAYLKIKERREK